MKYQNHSGYKIKVAESSKPCLFVSPCVSSVFPLALTSLAFWTLEAGGVAGQNRRESSMDPASHTGPRRLSGQALQDQLADGCLRIMTSAADCWGRGRLIAPLEALWVRLLVRLSTAQAGVGVRRGG
ncbi:hypothetical protein INR49_009860 [Caranx melampygus]|nr:hypothetical protein INR49_009860 [Caranx melampygus]